MSNPIGGIAQATGMLDPLGSMVGGLLQQIGLPKEIVNVAKIALGVASQNWMMAASGATGLISDLAKNPPGATEYCPPKDKAKCADGYAKPRWDGDHKERARTDRPPPRTGTPAGSPESTGRDATRLADLEAQYKHLNTIYQFFRSADSAGVPLGIKDGLIARDNLAHVLGNPLAPSHVKDAARWLLENFSKIDNAAHIGGKDGLIGRADVLTTIGSLESQISELKRKMAGGSRPPPPPGSSPGVDAKDPACGTPEPEGCDPKPADSGAGASKVRDIVNDPSLSMEEKIQMILMAVTDSLNEELMDTMEQLGEAETKKKNADPNDAAANQAADQSIQKLTLRIQQLVERQKRMFDLMSNLSTKFNEMANRAISNLGR